MCRKLKVKLAGERRFGAVVEDAVGLRSEVQNEGSAAGRSSARFGSTRKQLLSAHVRAVQELAAVDGKGPNRLLFSCG